jgi:hypothetical protein
VIQISISNLQDQDTRSLLTSLKYEQNELINTAVDRALDARKISGGVTGGCIPGMPLPPIFPSEIVKGNL